MAQTKGGNGKVATDDLLADIEDAEPVARKSGPRASAPFTPDPALMERIGAAFAKGGAFGLKRAFPTDKDARKAARVYLQHALEVASANYENKSAALRLIANEDGTFHVTIQLTHKRQAKETETETASETPAPEATA